MTPAARREYLRTWRTTHPSRNYMRVARGRRHTRRQRVYPDTLSHHRVLTEAMGRIRCDVCGALVEWAHSQEGRGFKCERCCVCGKEGTA